MTIVARKQMLSFPNLALAITQDKPVLEIPGPIGEMLRDVQKLGDLSGKEGEVTVLYPHGPKVQRLMVVGLGKKRELDMAKVRKAVGRVMKRAVRLKWKAIVFDVESFAHNHLKALDICQAISLVGSIAQYQYKEFKLHQTPDEKPVVVDVALAVEKTNACIQHAREGRVIGEAVNFARTLANQPANKLFPLSLAEQARKMARKYAAMRVKILRLPEMRRMGMGALLAVGAGSQRPPVLIDLFYKGGKTSERPVVFIGKGITFDSGGISLKPSNKMDEMRFDMSGAATVLGTIKAAAQLKLPVNIAGIIPAAENMPSGSASRPGDIVRSMSGQTIEILNTDAEGRLVLADGITYAKKYNPQCIIDFATLTGAVVVALGNVASGLISNDYQLAEEIKKAADVSGEKVWQLPLWNEYRDLIKSDVADMANIGSKSGAGTIVGAAFVEKFIGKIPWIHLDIAGTAYGDAGSIYSKGATGVGICLALEWLKQRIKRK
ncbi:leucyl aminopeptidase [candidate division FCPU426 bacterium]|nr:leucyl aminopeptidase [candidate division FCPU426 bacterium]